MNINISCSERMKYDTIIDTPHATSPYEIYGAIEAKVSVYQNKIIVEIGCLYNMTTMNLFYVSRYELTPSNVVEQIKGLDVDIRKQQLVMDIWESLDTMIKSIYVKYK